MCQIGWIKYFNDSLLLNNFPMGSSPMVTHRRYQSGFGSIHNWAITLDSNVHCDITWVNLVQEPIQSGKK